MWDIPKLISDNVVYAGFREARRDIQELPEAQSARASPNPHYEEYMDARPDQEEMEEAINKFLVQLEWASSDTTCVCRQCWKAFLMHPGHRTTAAPGNKYTADSHDLCDSNCNVACETGMMESAILGYTMLS